MFENNLKYINNPALARRLSKISSMESRVGISYCVAESGDYVLLKDELPSDDLKNPREAIKKMLASNVKRTMQSNDIIIAFGMGLGYLLDEVFNTYPSRIYIYEPDLNLLHFVLNNVDISEHLSSGRVYITNDMDELLNKLSETFLTNDKIEIVYLTNYAMTKNNELLTLTQKIYDTCKSKTVDINTIINFSKKWLMNTIENITYIQDEKAHLLSDIENKFVGQTALIAAAGPSLNDNIEKILANRDKFVIFAVNKAVKYLFQKGIKPDFIVCLDAENMNRTLDGMQDYLKDTNCIMDVRSDSALFSLNFNKIFINFSNTDFLMHKVARYNDFMTFNESGGTASSLALTSAIKMGFSKIVFAGIDLALKDNQIYSTGEVVEMVSQDEIKVAYERKKLVTVKSVKGTPVSTREDYEVYIHHFAEILKNMKYSEVYNITSFGADIKGVKNVEFDNIELANCVSMTALNNITPFKFKLEEFMQDEFKNINEIISYLSRGTFSPAFVTSIVNSVFIYQFMQNDVLNILQKNLAPELADDFIGKTKNAIKVIVEKLQKHKLI